MTAQPRIVSFVVEGPPVPKGRPRVNTLTGHAYTPKRTREYEDRIGNAWIALSPRPPMFVGGIGVEVVVHEDEKQHAADIDNYLKIALDALNNVAWADDVAVSMCHALVRRKTSDPFMAITISEVRTG